MMIEHTLPTTESEVSRLYEEMQANSLTALWRIEEAIMPQQPRPKVIPWFWKWADLYDVAQRALSNPGLAGQPFATPTLWAAIQWLNGHEVAPAHRHTAQAVRFIINGSGSWSMVEGDSGFLERGDFVLTPSWLWHDHGSQADEPAVWVDGLDIPLNNYLDASFFQPYPSEAQEVTQALNSTVLKYGVGHLQPAWERRSVQHPPHAYVQVGRCRARAHQPGAGRCQPL